MRENQAIHGVRERERECYKYQALYSLTSILSERKEEKLIDLNVMIKMMSSKSCSKEVYSESESEKVTVDEAKRENGGARVSLTVWRKSLMFSCNGFTVIDCNGNIVYRVDNYMIEHPRELILMDGFGKSLLTMCRSKRKLRVAESWFVYEGEVKNEAGKERKKPICRVKKNRRRILRHVVPNSKVLAYVYNEIETTTERKQYSYSIEGSYGNRVCKVLDAKRRVVVAEIKRKQQEEEEEEESRKGKGKGVSLGAEVFLLIVLPGFDSQLAMALVLLLDQMFS